MITSASYRTGLAADRGLPAASSGCAHGSGGRTPDPERAQSVTACIVLNAAYAPDNAMHVDLQQHAETWLAAYEYPRIIHFVDDLPLTATGKVIRRELREYAARAIRNNAGQYCSVKCGELIEAIQSVDILWASFFHLSYTQPRAAGKFGLLGGVH